MKKQSKKMFNVALATTLAAGAVVAVAPVQADASAKFSDVSEKNSHAVNIQALSERGVIKGYEDGTFRPNATIKRSHAAKIIAGVLGLDTKNVKNPGFKDVPATSEYYGAIAALANAGIINGYKEDNTFRPNGTLTRGQMAKIIANAFELKSESSKHPFKDIAKSSYKDNVIALYSNGVTVGKTATTYDTVSPVTRAQLSTFVIKAEKVKLTTFDKLVKAVVNETKTQGSEYVDADSTTFNYVSNNVTLVVKDENKKVNAVYADLHAKGENEDLVSLIDNLSDLTYTEAKALLNTDIKIYVGDNEVDAFKARDYISDNLDVNRVLLVTDAKALVKAQLGSNYNNATLKTVKDTFKDSNAITVEVGNETYTITVK